MHKLEGRDAFRTYFENAIDLDGQEVRILASLMRGGSAIIDPFGRVLAGPDFSAETILHAEIDLDQIPRGKFDLDVTGHYARPDVFQLVVDDRPKRAVSTPGTGA